MRYILFIFLFLVVSCSSSNLNNDKELFRILISPISSLNGNYLVKVNEDGYMSVLYGSRTHKDAFNKEGIYKKKYMNKNAVKTEKMLTEKEVGRLKSILDEIHRYEETNVNLGIAGADIFFIGYKDKTYGINESVLHEHDDNLTDQTSILFFVEQLKREIKQLSPVEVDIYVSSESEIVKYRTQKIE